MHASQRERERETHERTVHGGGMFINYNLDRITLHHPVNETHTDWMWIRTNQMIKTKIVLQVKHFSNLISGQQKCRDLSSIGFAISYAYLFNCQENLCLNSTG